MEKIAIITDSNSGISPSEAKELGIFIVPMPLLMNEKEYFENVDLTQDKFYEMLESDPDVSTSQPSPGDVMDLWEDVLKTYESIVYIPMSSGLSASWQTACGLAQDFDEKVQVVNNQRISVTMRQSVLDALAMAKDGKSGAEIKEYLENDALNAPIFIMVNTLKYLKKGGRVTAAGAAIGEVLNIKPVLKIDGGKLDAYAKVRGVKQAVKTILKALEEERDTRLKGKKCIINGAYSGDDSVGEEWGRILQEAFPDCKIEVYELPMSICSHIGPGAMGVGIYSAYQE